MKFRLDHYMAAKGIVPSRSQAESYIRLGKVRVNGTVVTKTGHQVRDDDAVELTEGEQYVSRAGLKLASVSRALSLDFTGKTVLDVGSSTGGFTDFALQHGADSVIAVEVGTGQLHPKLRDDDRIELHEQTDIRDFIPAEPADITVIDVSFISLRDILPHIADISGRETLIVAMLKPQFESGSQAKNKGVIKNDRLRRDILKDFEAWAKGRFVIVGKSDSEVPGAKGNRERFYALKKALA